MLPDLSPLTNNELFLTFQRLFPSVILSNTKLSSTKEDEMLLVESITRSYLTHFRSIYSFPRHLSLLDFFLSLECQFFQKLEHQLSSQTEQLLEIFAGIEIPSSKTETFIRSI
jgi:hypothetical protein